MMLAGWSAGPTPKPEGSWLMPPIGTTGTVPSAARRTSSIICPAFWSMTAGARAGRGRLGGVAEDEVRQRERRVGPLAGEVEGEHHEIDRLLHRGGREDEGAVVPVAAGRRRVEVVALPAHHVDDHARDLRV